MDSYTTVIEAADKLQRETDHMRMMRNSWISVGSAPEHVELMLAQAKRVRRTSNLLVRALARHREQL